MNTNITLSKYQGLGNDYLILDPNKNKLQLVGKKIELLCQRGFGIGADGVECIRRASTCRRAAALPVPLPPLGP